VRHMHQIAIIMVFCTSVVVDGLAPVAGSIKYLQNGQFDMRLDQREYQTIPTLNPAHQYEVRIVSSYTLKPLIAAAITTSGYRCYSPAIPDCYLPILIDGELVPIHSTASDNVAAFFLKPDSDAPDHWDRFYIPQLRLIKWGTGRPLRLKSVADFSDAVPTITVEITDISVQQQREREALYASRKKVGIAVGVGILVLAICAAMRLHTAPSRDKRRVARLTRDIQDELKRMENMRRTF
jgi:hypothetical protein